MRTNQLRSRRSSQYKDDSVYLYSPENKDLYNNVLENFNKSDCIFNRNLLAYLEEEKGNESFYSKHILSCESCQAKAREYRKMMSTVKTSIPIHQMNGELDSMMRSEIADVADLLNREEVDPHALNLLDTFKSSLKEFTKGFFFSREIVLGFLLSSVVVLFTLIYK